MKLKKLIYAVSAILTAAFLSVSADYIDIENESLGMRVDILEPKSNARAAEES